MTNIGQSDICPVWVVIPAAGIGSRMQSGIPKQYLKIGSKTVLEHTLDRFLSHPYVSGIIVVLNSEDTYWSSIPVNHLKIPLYTVEGGKERSDSVLQALEYLLAVEQLEGSHWIMVHDAARPCLSSKDIDSLLSLTQKSNCIGGILASPVRDTMKRAMQGTTTISHTENRDDLWHALTPQMFRLDDLYQALKQGIEADATITDEASAMERLDYLPELVEGSSQNFKITQPGDIEQAQMILSYLDNDNR